MLTLSTLAYSSTPCLKRCVRDQHRTPSTEHDTKELTLPFEHANLPSSDPAKVSEGVAGDQADVTDLQEVLRSTRNDLTASASDARKPKEKAVGTKTTPEWTNG